MLQEVEKKLEELKQMTVDMRKDIVQRHMEVKNLKEDLEQKNRGISTESKELEALVEQMESLKVLHQLHSHWWSNTTGTTLTGGPTPPAPLSLVVQHHQQHSHWWSNTTSTTLTDDQKPPAPLSQMIKNHQHHSHR